jgi:hypothetical protein
LDIVQYQLVNILGATSPVRNLMEGEHLGDPGVYGRIMLRLIFRKWNVGVWTGSNWLRIGTGGGHL